MHYEQQLRLLCDTFRKCRVQTMILGADSLSDSRLTSGLRVLLAGKKTADGTLLENATVYRATDSLSCNYIFFRLPEFSADAILLIGPYLTSAPTQKQIMEWGEQNSIAPDKQRQLAEQYADMPLFPESSHLFLMLETFFEHLWGTGSYRFVDLNWEFLAQPSPIAENSSLSDEPMDSLWNIRMIEKRYEFENELISAVASGQSQKLERLLSDISTVPFEQRLSDPLRDCKNHNIIANTLMRKAAEQGGVPPIYLDRISSDFARKIEQQNSQEASAELMKQMLHGYCRLVRKHAMKHYSPLIQKAITCIDAELSANLSLKSLAKRLNVSGSYLSTTFRKETGDTITNYITYKRIRHAMHLLSSTGLQVQTIAQHCGIWDIHYFSKLFKKATGLTPKEYRESLKN